MADGCVSFSLAQTARPLRRAVHFGQRDAHQETRSRVYGSIQDPSRFADEINNALNGLARLRVHFAYADAFSHALARNMTRREFLSRDVQEKMISLTQLPPKSRRVKSLQ
jgi:hypothetical protein